MAGGPERPLEPAWAREKYASLADHVEADRLRVPAPAVWVSIVAFCSIHVIAPSSFGLFLCWMLLCYRGRNIVELVEGFGSEAFLAIQASRLPPELKGAADGLHNLACNLGRSDIFLTGRELVMCPSEHAFGIGVDSAAPWPLGWLFDTTGTSMVCRLCAWVDPGVVLASFVALMVVSLLWPSGEWAGFVRGFETWFDVFSFKLHIDQARFDPGRRTVYVAVPHGIVPLGSFMTVAYVRRFLPGLGPIKWCVASVLFRVPFLRQFFLWLGCVPADRSILEQTLAEPGGKVALMSGGIAEIFLSSRNREQVFLQQRRGFVRLAAGAKADIVPVYIFGQTRLFDQFATSDGLAMRLSRHFSASLTFFWGRGYLPIPYKTAITVVVGNPIKLDPGLDPADGDGIARAHATVCSHMESMYRQHQDKAGYGGIPLEIK